MTKLKRGHGRLVTFDPSDPRSLEHPVNRELIDELGDEIARGMAREDYAKERAAREIQGESDGSNDHPDPA